MFLRQLVRAKALIFSPRLKFLLSSPRAVEAVQSSPELLLLLRKRERHDVRDETRPELRGLPGSLQENVQCSVCVCESRSSASHISVSALVTVPSTLRIPPPLDGSLSPLSLRCTPACCHSITRLQLIRNHRQCYWDHSIKVINY